jgi:hypothetical protein
LITQLQSGTFANAWKSILKVYEDKRNDDEKVNGSISGSKFICYLILRLIFIPVIVIWFIVGAFTFGLFCCGLFSLGKGALKLKFLTASYQLHG